MFISQSTVQISETDDPSGISTSVCKGLYYTLYVA